MPHIASCVNVGVPDHPPGKSPVKTRIPLLLTSVFPLGVLLPSNEVDHLPSLAIQLLANVGFTPCRPLKGFMPENQGGRNVAGCRQEEPLALPPEHRIAPVVDFTRGEVLDLLPDGRRQQSLLGRRYGADRARHRGHEPVPFIVAAQESLPIPAVEQKVPLMGPDLEDLEVGCRATPRNVEVLPARIAADIDRERRRRGTGPLGRSWIVRPELDLRPDGTEVLSQQLWIHTPQSLRRLARALSGARIHHRACRARPLQRVVSLEPGTNRVHR